MLHARCPYAPVGIAGLERRRRTGRTLIPADLAVGTRVPLRK